MKSEYYYQSEEYNEERKRYKEEHIRDLTNLRKDGVFDRSPFDIYHPTCELRIRIVDVVDTTKVKDNVSKKSILEQKWVDQLGTWEWHPLPVVE